MMKRALATLGLLSLAGIAGAAKAAPPGEPAAVRPLRYLALGDSYTIGEGAAPSDRWPVQLAGLLRQRGIQMEGPQIIARTGWTVAELDRGIDAAAPRGPYDLVTLLIGVNDQYRGSDPETYRPGFARMLSRAIALAGGDPRRVVVLSIPDWAATPFARRSGRDPVRISAAIDRFNEVNRQEALKANIRFIDITPASRRAMSESSLLASDGLHYAGPMYLEWARLALPVVTDAISVSPRVKPPQIRK
jgi:lysophospholipase L1-like esterase